MGGGVQLGQHRHYRQNYKDALNLATTEIRKSKRTFEKKLAGNIKKLQQEFLSLCKELTESSR